jgi:dTDP-4-amino-4,6-dideoxygalactose transaminase
LGGDPIFAEKVNIVRPVLPGFSDVAADVENILSTGMVTKGRYLKEFEDAIAAHLNVRHAVAVSSCTTGLMLTYKSLGLTGDVVVPSFTFMATVSSLVWSGLHPVFADVNPETTNLDPAAAEAAITPNTSAIVGVHNFGNPAEIEELRRIAKKHNLKLIFDAAHGFGSLYRGEPVGNQADAHVFSLSPTKLLIANEGGIVSTNDDELAANIRMGREYGNSGNYDSAFAGMNARMPEFNALIGLRSLEMLEEAAQKRNEYAAYFQEMLGRLPGIKYQQIDNRDRSSYKDFSITVDASLFGLDRDSLAVALAAENIDTRKYYEPPVHRQTAYRHLYDGRPLPNTDWLAENSLSFPIWSDMDRDVIEGIVQAMERIYQYNQPVKAHFDKA